MYTYKGKQFRNSPKSWQYYNGGKRILFGHWVLSGDQSLRNSGDPGGSIAVKYVIHNIEKTQVWISSDSDIDMNPVEEWYGNPTSDKADILLQDGTTIQVRLGNPDNPRSEDQSLHVFFNGRDLDGEPDHHNTDTDTPLHWALKNGQVYASKLLIDNGADVNAKNNDGHTPLHYACVFGHVDAAKLLIHNEANVNAKDNDGYTPLHCACENGHVDVAKLLIEKGADVNAKNNDGNTAHRLAMMKGHQELAILMVTEEMKLLGFSGPPQESMAKRAVKELAKEGAKHIVKELFKAALGGM